MNNATNIQEFRAKKLLDNTDYNLVASHVMAVEDMILQLERDYQEEMERNSGMQNVFMRGELS